MRNSTRNDMGVQARSLPISVTLLWGSAKTLGDSRLAAVIPERQRSSVSLQMVEHRAEFEIIRWRSEMAMPGTLGRADVGAPTQA
jgi:hypothetical protein